MRKAELILFVLLFLLYINKALGFIEINIGWLAVLNFIAFLILAIGGRQIYRSRGGESPKQATILATYCGIAFGLGILAIFSKTLNWINNFSIAIAIPNAILFFILLYLIITRLKNKRYRSASFYSALILRSALILFVSASLIAMPFYKVNIYLNKGDTELYNRGLIQKSILDAYEYYDNGNYEAALQFADKANTYYKLSKLDSANYYHISKIYYYAYSGLLYSSIAKSDSINTYKYAELIKQPLKIVFGDTSKESAEIKTILGSFYEEKGNYDVSDSLYNEVLVIYEESFGTKNIYYATTLHLLANSYRDRSYYKYANKLYKSAIKIVKEANSEYVSEKDDDFTDKAFINQSLGKVYEDLALSFSNFQEYDSAEVYFTRAFAIKDFKNSKDYDKAYLHYAYHTMNKGDYKRAKSMMEEALNNALDKYGRFSKEYLDALYGLNAMNINLAFYREAEKGCNEALQIYKSKYFEKAIYYSSLNFQLATVKHRMADYESAELYYKEALYYVNAGTTNYADILLGQANLQTDFSEYTNALKLVKEALGMVKNNDAKDDDTYFLKFYKKEADILYNLNQINGAEKLLLKCLNAEIFQNQQSKLAFSTTLNGLGLIRTQQKNHIAADTLFDAALRISMDKLGENHPENGIIIFNKAHLKLAEGNLAEAESLLNKSYVLLISTYGQNHDKIADNLKALGELRLKQNRIPEALEKFTQAYNIYKSKFKSQNSKTIYTLKLMNLAKAKL